MHPIDEVVQSVLWTRGIWKKLEVDEQLWYYYRNAFKSGKMNHETKRKIAEMGGYRLCEPEQWISDRG